MASTPFLLGTFQAFCKACMPHTEAFQMHLEQTASVREQQENKARCGAQKSKIPGLFFLLRALFAAALSAFAEGGQETSSVSSSCRSRY